MTMLHRRLLAAVLLGGAVACDDAVPRAADLVADSPIEQTAVAGEPVASPPAVRVTTDRGQPMAGVAVTFSVAAGGGSIDRTALTTDERGTAALTRWTMGTGAGENRVIASVSGVATKVTFRANGVAGPPAGIEVVTGPAIVTRVGQALAPQPVVRVVDAWGNPVREAGRVVTADAGDPAVTVSGGSASTDTAGTATFTNLALDGPVGSYTLRFSTAGLPPATAPSATALVDDVCIAPLALDFSLGEFRRFTLDSAAAPDCLDFDMARNLNQQFLVLLENMPRTGAFNEAIFPGVQAPSTFTFTLGGLPRSATGAIVAGPVVNSEPTPAGAPAGAVYAWDFGEGPIYEIEPMEPPAGAGGVRLLSASGAMVDVNSEAANPQVGDTLVVFMEGISRLGIPSGNQRAVVRRVSEHLVIAEDVRLGTLTRDNGRTNTPLSTAVMDSIVLEYEQYARVQGDLLFEGRHNAAVENRPPPRVVAVHSLMYANNVWGYTYTTSNYFVWDYWVATDGSTRGLNQTPQRVADNLFMHEIAHMRHRGLLERNGLPPRGNRWLVEGFARFSERLPIAARLLGTTLPSRTGNIVLPRNPAFGNSYFRDDVPTFLNAGSMMFDGYQASAFVFDYFADHVAAGGVDWMRALREFLVAGGSPVTLDAKIGQWLPGLSFEELFTRARLALYLDDIGTPGLPPWTQYLQFQLRASRPAGSASSSDPRNAWPSVRPGTSFESAGIVAPGAATGFVVDGTQPAGSGFVFIYGPRTPNAVLSITRIR